MLVFKRMCRGFQDSHMTSLLALPGLDTVLEHVTAKTSLKFYSSRIESHSNRGARYRSNLRGARCEFWTI